MLENVADFIFLVKKQLKIAVCIFTLSCMLILQLASAGLKRSHSSTNLSTETSREKLDDPAHRSPVKEAGESREAKSQNRPEGELTRSQSQSNLKKNTSANAYASLNKSLSKNLDETIERKKRDNNYLTMFKKDLEPVKKTLNDEVRNLETDINGYKKKLEKTKNDLETSKSNLAKTEQDLRGLHDFENLSNDKIDNLYNKYKTYTDTISSWLTWSSPSQEEKIQHLNSVEKNKKAEKNSIESTIQNEFATIEKHNSMIEKLGEELTIKKKELEKVNEAYEKKEEEINNVTKYRVNQDALQKLNDRIKVLDTRLDTRIEEEQKKLSQSAQETQDEKNTPNSGSEEIKKLQEEKEKLEKQQKEEQEKQEELSNKMKREEEEKKQKIESEEKKLQELERQKELEKQKEQAESKRKKQEETDKVKKEIDQTKDLYTNQKTSTNKAKSTFSKKNNPAQKLLKNLKIKKLETQNKFLKRNLKSEENRKDVTISIAIPSLKKLENYLKENSDFDQNTLFYENDLLLNEYNELHKKLQQIINSDSLSDVFKGSFEILKSINSLKEKAKEIPLLREKISEASDIFSNITKETLSHMQRDIDKIIRDIMPIEVKSLLNYKKDSRQQLDIIIDKKKIKKAQNIEKKMIALYAKQLRNQEKIIAYKESVGQNCNKERKNIIDIIDKKIKIEEEQLIDQHLDIMRSDIPTFRQELITEFAKNTERYFRDKQYQLLKKIELDPNEGQSNKILKHSLEKLSRDFDGKISELNDHLKKKRSAYEKSNTELMAELETQPKNNKSIKNILDKAVLLNRQERNLLLLDPYSRKKENLFLQDDDLQETSNKLQELSNKTKNYKELNYGRYLLRLQIDFQTIQLSAKSDLSIKNRITLLFRTIFKSDHDKTRKLILKTAAQSKEELMIQKESLEQYKKIIDLLDTKLEEKQNALNQETSQDSRKNIINTANSLHSLHQMHRQYSKDYLDLMLVFEKSLKNKKLKPFVNQEIEALPLAKTTIFDSITQKKIITGSNDIKNIENLPNDIKVILASIDAHNLAFAQEVHKNMFYTIQQNSEDRPNQFKLFIEQQTLSHEKINTFIEKINTETVITKEMLGLQELQFSLPSKTNKKEPGRNSP